MARGQRGVPACGIRLGEHTARHLSAAVEIKDVTRIRCGRVEDLPVCRTAVASCPPAVAGDDQALQRSVGRRVMLGDVLKEPGRWSVTVVAGGNSKVVWILLKKTRAISW
jgi:hypothetical protein